MDIKKIFAITVLYILLTALYTYTSEQNNLEIPSALHGTIIVYNNLTSDIEAYVSGENLCAIETFNYYNREDPVYFHIGLCSEKVFIKAMRSTAITYVFLKDEHNKQVHISKPRLCWREVLFEHSGYYLYLNPTLTESYYNFDIYTQSPNMTVTINANHDIQVTYDINNNYKKTMRKHILKSLNTCHNFDIIKAVQEQVKQYFND